MARLATAAGVAAVVAGSWNAVPTEAAQLRKQQGTFPSPADIPAFHIANGTSPPSIPAAGAALEAHGPVDAKAKVVQLAGQAPGAFQNFYAAYNAGPGIWKWSNALAAYDRFYAAWAGQPVKIAEVGVQSGGSMLMWKSVLGPQAHIYGLDINPATNKFADPQCTITIGDQADPVMWQNFFASTTQSPIDGLIDDGGHEAHQMLTTLTSVFDNLTPGGVIAIEDIHGEHYVQSFFTPAAQYLGQKAAAGQVSSVHMFPFLMLAKKAGNDFRAPIYFQGTTETVADFNSLWAAIPRHWGGHVILENAGWGPFLTPQGISNFFQVFGALHHSVWYDTPHGCEHTAAAVCTVQVTPGQMQAVVTGIHIFPNRLVVEVAGGPVNIQAVRHGTEWLPY